MSAPRGQDPPPEASPVRFVLAAIALGIIAVLGVVVVATGSSKRSAAPAAEAAATPARPKAIRSTARSTSICGLPDGSSRVPTEEPPSTRWARVGTMLVPTAPTSAGPGVVDDGVRTCFAHSPEGALHAAASFWATSAIRPVGQVMRRLVAASPERDRAIATDGGARSADPGVWAQIQIAGYHFVSYDQHSAVIALAMRTTRGALASVPTTLRWEDGDWKYVLSPNGDPGVTTLSSMAGYTAWAGA